MAKRTIPSQDGGQFTVDPTKDELVLDSQKDRPDVQYFCWVSAGAGATRYYVYRPAQQAFGERIKALCAEVTLQEVQEAITERARYAPLAEYADLARLGALGFTVPERGGETA